MREDEHKTLYRFVANAAIKGGLDAVDALMENADYGTRWLVFVLFKTDSWPVRVHAAEQAYNYASGTELRPDEQEPLLWRLRKLDEMATSEDVRLSEHERKQVRDLDPDRLLAVNDVPDELAGWFGDIADKIAEAQSSFSHP